MPDLGGIERIGVFSQVHGATGQPIADVYARLLDAIVAADELGVDTFWVGQHHVDPTSGRLPSPFPLLAAAAERTTRIRLGVAVVILPLEDPLRLAEDVAVVDALSGGRIEVGLGTGGGAERAYAAFGQPADAGARRALFDQKTAALEAALGGVSLTGEPHGPRLEPPASGVRERLWQAVGTVERGRAAARRGHRLLTGTFSDTQEQMRDKALAYRDEWKKAHAGVPPRISAGRFVYTGASKEAIADDVAAAVRAQQRRFSGGTHGLAGLSVSGYLDRVARYGTVEDVIGQLRADRGILGVATDFHTILSLYPAAGDVTPGADVEVPRIVELVEVIAPALGWAPAYTTESQAAGR